MARVSTKAPATRLAVINGLRITEQALRNKSKPLTVAQRAKILDVKPGMLRTPLDLTPARPIDGKRYIQLFSCMMMDPTFPAATGQALFSSLFPGAVFPACQVAFPRVKKGKNHLVEFQTVLHGDGPYKFRVFTYPLGQFEDVSVQGNQAHTFTALVPPVDQISGDLELGAEIQQRNETSDAAGWTLHAVRITTVG